MSLLHSPALTGASGSPAVGARSPTSPPSTWAASPVISAASTTSSGAASPVAPPMSWTKPVPVKFNSTAAAALSSPESTGSEFDDAHSSGPGMPEPLAPRAAPAIPLGFDEVERPSYRLSRISERSEDDATRSLAHGTTDSHAQLAEGVVPSSSSRTLTESEGETGTEPAKPVSSLGRGLRPTGLMDAELPHIPEQAATPEPDGPATPATTWDPAVETLSTETHDMWAEVEEGTNDGVPAVQTPTFRTLDLPDVTPERAQPSRIAPLPALTSMGLPPYLMQSASGAWPAVALASHTSPPIATVESPVRSRAAVPPASVTRSPRMDKLPVLRDPVPEPEPESTSALEPVPESSSEPMPESTPQPVPETTQQPMPESTPQPVPGATQHPMPESSPQSEPQSMPRLMPESSPQPVPESPQPVPESVPQPVPESSPRPVPESSPQPVPGFTRADEAPQLSRSGPSEAMSLLEEDDVDTIPLQATAQSLTSTVSRISVRTETSMEATSSPSRAPPRASTPKEEVSMQSPFTGFHSRRKQQDELRETNEFVAPLPTKPSTASMPAVPSIENVSHTTLNGHTDLVPPVSQPSKAATMHFAGLRPRSPEGPPATDAGLERPLAPAPTQDAEVPEPLSSAAKQQLSSSASTPSGMDAYGAEKPVAQAPRSGSTITLRESRVSRREVSKGTEKAAETSLPGEFPM